MFKTGRIIRKGVFVVATMAAVAGLSGCVERVANHGFAPKAEAIATVTLGSDTRESVIEKLGRPTMGGVLEDGGLYYVSYQMRHYGAMPPKEIDRTVVAVTFDAGGIARNIETFGLADGRVVSLSRRVTDDNLRDNVFLRQLLGSIGRFNAADIFGSD